MTLGNEIFSPQIVQTKHKLSESGKYYCPHPGIVEDYTVMRLLSWFSLFSQNYIRSLPINDHPEVFGMHENADITSAINENKELFEALLPLYNVSTGAITAEEDKIVLGVAEGALIFIRGWLLWYRVLTKTAFAICC